MSSRRLKRKAFHVALGSIKRQMNDEEEKDETFLVEESHAPSKQRILVPQKEAVILPILFCNDTIEIPQDIFGKEILGFITQKELVHRVSLVSKAWNQASKDPDHWIFLDRGVWRKHQSRLVGYVSSKTAFSSMPQFFSFLQRPQFSKLVRLVPPDMYRTKKRDVFHQLAKVCPGIEDLDVSGTNRKFSPVPLTLELVRLPDLFPKLKTLRLCMRFVHRAEVPVFASLMGIRLENLWVEFLEIGADFYDETFQAIAKNCPNLVTLRYVSFFNRSPSHRQLSERGPIEVLKKCPKLKTFMVTVPLRTARQITNFAEKNHLPSRGLFFVLDYPLGDMFDDWSDEE